MTIITIVQAELQQHPLSTNIAIIPSASSGTLWTTKMVLRNHAANFFSRYLIPKLHKLVDF